MKIAVLILSTAVALGLAAPAFADLPPLIPRQVLFGNPERINPQISPDGKHLAYVAPDSRNVLQVWVRSIVGNDERVLTADKKRGIRSYFWTYDGEHLCYVQDQDGDENFHVYAVNIKTSAVRDLTPFSNIQARLVDRNPDFPGEILVALNKTDPRKHDVYRVNLKTAEVKLDTENPGNVMGWTADAEFRVRAALAMRPDGGRDLLFRETQEQAWKTILKWGSDDEGQPLAFSKDGKSLFILGNHDANTMRLLSRDLAAGTEQVLADDSTYDVGGVMIHPVTYKIQAVSFARDKVEWKVLDPSIADDFEAIKKVRPGQFSVGSRDLADKTWLVSFVTDDGPVYYYSYDRSAKKATFLFTHQPKLEGLPLAKMKPISFQSMDGLTIHGYLTVPVGVQAKNLPTVLLVHGGPWGRDMWGYSSMVQFLANRGYAVLQVNFRGSTGYGKQFLNAGNREWAGKMHQDLIDAVNWIVKEGVADPKRVAIMGGSYGGYATLVGLTFTPDVFACGVDIVGPSNILTLLKTIPPYWVPIKAMFTRRVGDIEKDEEFLKSRSPFFFADKIKVPLLIGQGANDPRVKQAESDQIVAAMRKAGKPVEYVIYTDEGHGFARPENNLHFMAKTEEFLAKYLGGRAESMGDLMGHSAVIK